MTESFGSFTAELLEDVIGYIRRFVVVTVEQADVVGLWVLHTWRFEAWETTPYLHITSPLKRSGKSGLLDVLECLCADAVRAGGTTEAALFRLIDEATPTLLLDEIDAIFGPKARDHEDLRAVFNNGYRIGTPILRVVGEGKRRYRASVLQIASFDEEIIRLESAWKRKLMSREHGLNAN